MRTAQMDQKARTPTGVRAFSLLKNYTAVAAKVLRGELDGGAEPHLELDK